MSIDVSIPINGKLEVQTFRRDVANTLKELLGLSYEPEITVHFRLQGDAQDKLPNYLEPDSPYVLWLGLAQLEHNTYSQIYTCFLADMESPHEEELLFNERLFAVIGTSGGGFHYVMMAACILAICKRENAQVSDGSFFPIALFRSHATSVLENLRCKIPTENIEVAMSEVLKSMGISQNRNAENR